MGSVTYLSFVLIVCVDESSLCKRYESKKYFYCTHQWTKLNCKKMCNICNSGGNSTAPPSYAPRTGCGKTKLTGRVISGQDSKQGQWPWQIAMYRSGYFSCGGTLVSSQWIVTAAHCVFSSYPPSAYTIVLGDLDRHNDTVIEKKHTVERIIYHPFYKQPSHYNNDIAMIKLKAPVQMNDNIAPACLPKNKENVPVGTKCFISGWGKVTHPGNSAIKLQHAQMTVLDNTECSRLNSRYSTIEPQMVCAKNYGQWQSGCHGDSGGPFVCQGADGRWTLHGAVSWGSPTCDIYDAATVFARVSEFRDWIERTMRMY